MSRKFPKKLLVGAILTASLAFGAAPSYAQMAPDDAGISTADWDRVLEIGAYNNALMEYVDNQGEATLVFTGGNVPDELNYPSDFTGFDDPDLVLYGEYSQFATNDEVYSVEDDVVTQLSNAGYDVSTVYDEDTDVVDVNTTAPSSVTDPLVAQYSSKINIIAGTLESQTGSSSTKTHGAPHASKKAAKKPAAAKPAKSAKKATKATKATKKGKTAATPAPAPALQEPVKVVLRPASSQ